ncbi:MAG: GEVED domain-containing protein, partial [Verrucomicrobia bacterium]|nr:GEVED domain-containing protein [Verrucomicrobiota bacterium]
MRKKPLFTGLLLLQLVLSAGLSTNARADDPMDFGDADVGFPVYFTDDGARHIINPGVKMGTLVDEEADGTPSLLADVDDLDGDDDEDGVVFSRVSRPGETTMVSVVVSTSGYLQGWVDLDGFDWLGDGEHVYSNLFVTAGTNELSLVFPPDITPGIYQSRFRFSTVTNLEPTGEAPDGEVEDHVVYVFDADFGDAPEGIANGQYPTRFANTGAFHALGSGVFMGAGVTRDDDGLPAPDAQLDDDDGVSFLTALELGKTASIAVVLSSSASLSLWMDFDGDGSWNDADEFVYVEGLTAGTNVLYVAIPATAMFGKSYARFRLSTETVSYPYGYAADGEVEDYAIDLQTFDYGDAPEGIGPLGNPTLLTNNGPRHAVVTGVYLGESIDAELDGQPTIVAHGDDTHGAEDEDGVQFEPNVYPGLSMAVQVVASTGGLLQAWIDFNQNQSWADPGEQVLSNRVVVAGTNNLAIAIPVTASFGATFTRFRFSTQGDLGYAGAAADGEVEDYQVDFQEPFFDFGDAPHDPPFTNYPVSLIHNGPRHVIVPNIQLGSLIDQDFDGQPGPGADGDDNDGNDDDDGVALPGPLVPGFPGVAVVDASTGGYVQAWMDFNADGDWDEAREQVFSNIWVNGGVTNLAFQLPADTVAPQLFARFRFSRVPDLGVRGAAPDGEVEDLLATIDGFDFGDARGSLTLSSTPTRYSEDGARHLVVPGVHLGELIDSEPDGLPTPAADGDDTDASDDEDGVLFETYLLSGAPSSVMLTVSTTGYVQGWIDFNQDNVWGNGDEQFSKDQWVDTGTTNLVFVVPPLAMPGLCSARVRFSSVTNLPPTGMAPDGEVEDYVVIIRAPDLGDAPDSLGDPRYPTLIAHDGARHSIVTGIHLGDGVDGDSDGQPTSTADGDDTDGEDDDDGVLLLRPMRPGETTAIRVLASTNGYLQGWVDTEGDGDWSGPDEFLMQDVWLDAGYHVVPLTPSVTATVGTTFARYRFSTEPGLDVIGLAGDGEVEDYAVTIQALLPPESPAVDPCTEWLQRVNTNYGIDVASYGVPSIGGSGGNPVRVADDWPADGRAIGGVRWGGAHI